jgi:hypothetical protein
MLYALYILLFMIWSPQPVKWVCYVDMRCTAFIIVATTLSTLYLAYNSTTVDVTIVGIVYVDNVFIGRFR